MTRLFAGIVLGVAIFAVLYMGTIRNDRHPLLIDAAAPVQPPFCNHRQGPPLLSPVPRYDNQVHRSKDGGTA